MFAGLGLAAVGVGIVSLIRRVSALEVQLQQETTRKNEVAMDLCGLRNQHMESDHGKELGRAFNVRSTDVFIVTYPKCGDELCCA